MTDQERKAMEMVLDALEFAASEIYNEHNDDVIADAIKALRQVLAQPEQESTQEHESRITALEIRVAKLEKPMTDHEKQLMVGQRSLLRTAPPSKPLIALTDEEIADVWANSKRDVFDFVIPFARAIEAKLGEKNNG